MKNSSPILAAGWISTPVTARLVYEIAIGSPGTPASWRACATRWARIAWTPAQFMRISVVPMPRAAGSRSRADATSARISPAMRLRVPNPSIAPKGTELGLGCEERQRHVALAPVRNDHEDALAREFIPRRHPQPSIDRGAAGDAHQEPLLARRLTRAVQGVLVGDGDDLVDHRAVEHLGHEPRADALDLVRSGQPAREHRGGRGLDRHDVRRGPALLQHLPDARDGPPGADSADQR